MHVCLATTELLSSQNFVRIIVPKVVFSHIVVVILARSLTFSVRIAAMALRGLRVPNRRCILFLQLRQALLHLHPR